jgi:hypothetical protein
MLIASWFNTVPAASTRGHATIAGTRMPPSHR